MRRNKQLILNVKNRTKLENESKFSKKSSTFTHEEREKLTNSREDHILEMFPLSLSRDFYTNSDVAGRWSYIQILHLSDSLQTRRNFIGFVISGTFLS